MNSIIVQQTEWNPQMVPLPLYMGRCQESRAIPPTQYQIFARSAMYTEAPKRRYSPWGEFNRGREC